MTEPKTKKPKPQSTAQEQYAKIVKQLAERRAKALSAAVDIMLKGSTDELLVECGRKMSSYLTTKYCFETQWTVEGTKRANALARPYTGKYRLWAVQVEGGWIGQLNYHRLGEFIVAHATETPIKNRTEAIVAIRKLAEEIGISDRVQLKPRIFYEGELKFENETRKMDELKAGIDGHLSLMMIECGKKESDIEKTETMIKSAGLMFERWMSRRFQFNSQWNSDGQWIGPKKPVKAKREPKVQVDSKPECG